ncbi:MAG: efflux RND transporter periplasmic adaptor subunit [Pseudomonadota bacterium]
MDNKKALLGSLSLSEEERKSASRTPQFLVTGAGALGLAVLAWFWLVPDSSAVPVQTATAIAADGQAARINTAVLDASGYVTARRQATVSSKLTGKVTAVFIEEGVSVTEGELLATLDDSLQRASLELTLSQQRAAEARLAEVRVQIREAELDLQRKLELETKNLASRADLDNAELRVEGLRARLNGLQSEIEVARGSVRLQQQQLEDMQIRAPFAGVVIAKAAQPGEMISPVSAGGGFTRTGICTIVDMDSLEIEVDVNESYINRVTPGQRVVATLNSYQDWQIPAEVITIIPTADRNKATVRVRVAFLEKDSRILPDMGVKVSFLEDNTTPPDNGDSAPTGVWIPNAAVTLLDDSSTVFVVANGRAEPRQVRLGERKGSNRNVVSGLVAGDVVVTGLNEQIKQQLATGRAVVSSP